MTDALAGRERVKYEQVWRECPAYKAHSPGLRHAPEALKWYQELGCYDLTDFGAGDGRTVSWFHGNGVPAVRGLDIATRAVPHPLVEHHCLWDPVPVEWHADFAFSCDVLEHIPPERVDDVLAAMADATHVGGWMQIALFEDRSGTMGDWGPLHLTVRSSVWWRARVSEYFEIVRYYTADGPDIRLAMCLRSL